MAMRLHRAKDTGKQFYLQVWLDETKFLLDDEGNPTSEPDPKWLREWHWGKDNTKEQMLRETKLLAKTELAKMTSTHIKTLPEEGRRL